MILRPNSDAALIECVAEILADCKIKLDTRALIALLLLNKHLKICPRKSEIASMLAVDCKPPTSQRLARIVHDAERAGYFVRTPGHLNNLPGSQFRYWFVVTGKPEKSAHADEGARK